MNIALLGDLELETLVACPLDGSVKPDKALCSRESAIRTLTIEQRGLAAVIDSLKDDLGVAFMAAVEMIRAVQGNVVVTGMGKSGHIARKIAATFASTGTPSHFVHPAEASHGDLGMIRDNDLVLAISWSGETPELADIIAHTRRFRIPLIAITSSSSSALGLAADVGLYLPVMQEACPNGVAPTTSTTVQLVIGDALAVCLLEHRGFTASDFRMYHPGGRLGAKLKSVRELMRKMPDVPHVAEWASVGDALIQMSQFGLGYALVLSDTGKLVGILTDGDLRRNMRNDLIACGVGEIMSRNPKIVSPETLGVEALAFLQENRISAAPVAEGGVAIGGIHLVDFIRAGVL